MANYLDVPSASGASTPNQAGLAVGTTSLDLRIEMAPNTWATGFQALITQYVASAASGTRFWWGLLGPGSMEYTFYNTGGPIVQDSIATGFTAGSSHGVRVLHNVAAGTIDFYTSPDFTVWTPLGIQATGHATTTQAISGTAPVVRVGTDADNDHTVGKITKVMVLVNGVTVLNENFTTATVGNGPWVATSGETWTRIGTSSVVAAAAGVPGGMPLLGVGN